MLLDDELQGYQKVLEIGSVERRRTDLLEKRLSHSNMILRLLDRLTSWHFWIRRRGNRARIE